MVRSGGCFHWEPTAEKLDRDRARTFPSSIPRGLEPTFRLAAEMPYMLISTQIRLVRMLRLFWSFFFFFIKERRAPFGLSRGTQRSGSTTAPPEAAGYSWLQACDCPAPKQNNNRGSPFLFLSRCPEFKPHVAPTVALWARTLVTSASNFSLGIRDYNPHLPHCCMRSRDTSSCVRFGSCRKPAQLMWEMSTRTQM